MMTLSTIEEILDKFFDDPVIIEGTDYYYNDHVLDFAVSTDLECATAKIKGSKNKRYSAEVEIVGKKFRSSCTCPASEDCKHIVTLLLNLKNFLEEPSMFEEIPEHEEKTSTSANTTTKQNKSKKEKFKSNEYRKIDYQGRQHRFSDIVQQYEYKNNTGLAWYETYSGHFISPSELELKIVATHHHRTNSDSSIVIKSDEQGVWVKCLSCETKSNNFCKHQTAILYAAANNLQSNGFFEEKLIYHDIIKDGQKKLGFDIDSFDKYFKISFDKLGFNITSKDKTFVDDQWLKMAENFANKTKKLKSEKVKSELESLSQNESTTKYAFLWIPETHSRSSSIMFVDGPGYKTKEGIKAQLKTTSELPTYFPEPYKTVGRSLFFAIKEHLESDRFADVKKIILNNIDTFNQIYNYSVTDTYIHNYNKIPANSLILFKFHPIPLECKIKVDKIDGILQWHLIVTLENKPFDIENIASSNDFFCIQRGIAYLFPNEKFSGLLELFNHNKTLLHKKVSKKELTHLTASLGQHFDIEIPNKLVIKEKTLTHPTYQILLRETGKFILFEPRLKYDEYSFNAFEEDAFIIEKEHFTVDEQDRQFLANFLKNAHPEFDSTHQVQEYVYLDVKDMLHKQWFFDFSEMCNDASIEILGQAELSNFRFNSQRAKTYAHIKSGIDWFDVDIGVSFGKEQIATADWIKALRNKESFVTLKDGTLGILPEEWLKQATKILAVSEVNKGELQISKYRYNVIDDLFDDIDDQEIMKDLAKRKKRLLNLNTSKKYKVPKIIKATLRDYQKHGYTWLKFLDESGFGGILADDMGLGKTLQVISLLADKIKSPPSIVIVPRSLLHNWSTEIDKFCPSLSYIIHHGSGRAKTVEELSHLNVIISTYGTVTQDIEFLKTFKFTYIILDESQAIKNPDAQRYKAMRLLQSNNKIAMTGTPIENNTFDLFAQLSFTSPGLLGSRNSFKNNFSIPIDNQGDIEAAQLLRKLIHPFLLRRTKNQVAKDLPKKTESVIYCEMGDHQRRLYNNLKIKIKEDIEAEVEEKGLAKSKFKMLDGLLRLRQMCNSPLLINQSFKGANAESVKINLLLAQLDGQLKNHNALVFSQFVSLLSIVREALDKKGIPYAYLDGSTTNRKAQVDKFMNNDEVKIFLISIKAGNTGLNLTKADYVYILDPWWNPAVEAQAIDRTHRIGQDKQIFAYKMICKDSIEEKILKLQQKKRKLADDIIRTDENIMKSLKKNDLMALFD